MPSVSPSQPATSAPNGRNRQGHVTREFRHVKLCDAVREVHWRSRAVARRAERFLEWVVVSSSFLPYRDITGYCPYHQSILLALRKPPCQPHDQGPSNLDLATKTEHCSGDSPGVDPRQFSLVEPSPSSRHNPSCMPSFALELSTTGRFFRMSRGAHFTMIADNRARRAAVGYSYRRL